MVANGLAITVLTWVRVLTTSSRPGITAVPPASRMWSMLLNCVEVKKLLADAPSLIVACGLAMRRFDP